VLIDPASPTRAGLEAGWTSLGHRVDQLEHLGVIVPADPVGNDCTAEIASILPAFNADPMRPLTTDLGGTRCSTEARQRTLTALGSYDQRAVLTRITAPVLILHGRMDPYGDTPSEWVDNLRAPHEVIYLDDCGHRPMHECPAAIFPAIMGYATR
jgi:pimeloyl-ACP methyl ester carboxylesterase